jgi:predicted DNA-binding protein (MmcQ/YjbR family)
MFDDSQNRASRIRGGARAVPLMYEELPSNGKPMIAILAGDALRSRVLRASIAYNISMDIEKIREFCLSMPHATEDIQWEKDLLFRIGRKMFTVIGLEDGSVSFKCTPEEFGELTLKDGIEPAHYVARYHWVTVRKPKALKFTELKRLIQDSYSMIREKLPAKVKKQFER